jgi:hypothetical protein
MNERQPAQARRVVDWSCPLGAEQTAQDALALVSSGRSQMALRLLEKLPGLIAAEIEAADRDGYSRGHSQRRPRARQGS